MTAEMSAGLLLYRERDHRLEVLLVHPGGPFFRERDDGYWGVPKGLIGPGEDPLQAALRELGEETGFAPPPGPFLDLGTVRQKGGKVVRAWAAEGDRDPAALVSNTFRLEWPPRSGRFREFPEVDRCAWFTLAAARHRINGAQVAFLDRLAAELGSGEAPHSSE